MSWRLEVNIEENESIVYESIRLRMDHYAQYVGAVFLPHLVAIDESDTIIRAMSFNTSGMEPAFTETGFIVRGSKAILNTYRQSLSKRPDVTYSSRDESPKEQWTLSVH